MPDRFHRDTRNTDRSPDPRQVTAASVQRTILRVSAFMGRLHSRPMTEPVPDIPDDAFLRPR